MESGWRLPIASCMHCLMYALGMLVPFTGVHSRTGSSDAQCLHAATYNMTIS